jgi:hypothetical protein
MVVVDVVLVIVVGGGVDFGCSVVDVGLVIVVGGGVDVGCSVVDGVAIVVSPLVVSLVVEGRGVVVPLQIKLFHYIFVQ